MACPNIESFSPQLSHHSKKLRRKKFQGMPLTLTLTLTLNTLTYTATVFIIRHIPDGDEDIGYVHGKSTEGLRSKIARN